MSMDVKSKEVLEGILAKDKSSLNDDEVAFLRARRDYLNDEQRARFADLLDEKPAKKSTKKEDAE